MWKMLRSFSILAIASVILAWALSGCAPYHECYECPPRTHSHSYAAPAHGQGYGPAAAPC